MKGVTASNGFENLLGEIIYAMLCQSLADSLHEPAGDSRLPRTTNVT
jgi:hypothetical protein